MTPHKKRAGMHTGLALLALFLLLPCALGASDIIKNGTIEVNATGLNVLGFLNTTGGINVTGNMDILAGELRIGGTSVITSSRVGTFAAGTQVASKETCLDDDTNCPDVGTGWQNTTAQVFLTNNATNVSVGYVSSQPVLFIDNTNGKVGTGTTTPTTALHVTGNLNVTGNITAGDMIEIAPGTIIMYAGSTEPTGWLIANGSLIPNATYGRLCAMLGATYGASNGSHCRLPDLRARFALGLAASGTGSALGETGGSIDHTHTGPSHSHTDGSYTQPTHTHGAGNLTQTTHTHGAGNLTQPTHTHGAGTYDQPTHTHGLTVTTTASQTYSQNHVHTVSINSGDTSGSGGGSVTHTYDKSVQHGAAGDNSITGTSASGGDDAVTGTSDAGGNDDLTGTSASGGNDAVTGTTAADGTGASGSNNDPFIAVNYIIKT